ncbi:MAG: holo-ACP synthase [bacterium]
MNLNQSIFINTGIDIVYNKRISKNIYNLKFIKKILSVDEIQIYYRISNYKRKIEFLAGRFAAKEAITKSLSFKVNFNSVSIFYNNVIFLDKYRVFDKISKFFNKDIKDFEAKVSISHEKEFTVANAILIIYFS